MMKANDLRIGNVVYAGYNNKTSIIQAIIPKEHHLPTGPYLVKVDTAELLFDLDMLEGEPFTKEWADKVNGQITIELSSDGHEAFIRSTGPDVDAISPELVKYVHQVQNIYFALTGEELSLSEKQNGLSLDGIWIDEAKDLDL